MTSRHHMVSPPTWTVTELDEQRQAATRNFVEERLAVMTEGSLRYQAALRENVHLAEALFEATDDLLGFASGEALRSESNLTAIARYLGGPPISEANLDTLADATVSKRKRLDQTLARKTAEIIELALDRTRFAWLFATPPRPPTAEERSVAIRWTAGLRAVQQVQTSDRVESSSRQEMNVQDILLQQGFERVPRHRVDLLDNLGRGQFSREASVRGVKCDLPIRLRDGRMLLVECKVSKSSLNSIKRLNRECGGKAARWRREFGEQAITAAVLAGVFKLENLVDAQTNDRVVIFWEHKLATLAEFIEAAV